MKNQLSPLLPVQRAMSRFLPPRPLRVMGILLAMAAMMAPAQAVVQTIAVNSGPTGSEAAPFIADTYFSGGNTSSVSNTIDTTGVTNPAPQAVYRSERWGACTYTVPNLFATHNYTVRLHFAETFHNGANLRRFNVLINGTTVLTNFDIYATAGAKFKANVQEFQVAANASYQIVIQFQVGAADNPKISGIEIIDPDYVPPPFCLNVDVDHSSSTNNVYSGVGAAPNQGQKWNGVVLNASPNTAPANSTKTFSNLRDSLDLATTCSVQFTSSATSGNAFSSFGQTSTGNPNPLNLMKDYLFGNTYTVTVSGLAQKNYLLYVYAHGDGQAQNSTVTVHASNGGGSGVTANSGSEYRNIFSTSPAALGYSYLKFPVSVGAAGTLTFTAAPAATASNGYLNGFQLLEFPKPTITTQPPANPSVTAGNSITIPMVATGEGTLTYQWRKGGVNLANGASGTGSTYAGVTTNTLNISNAQSGAGGDAGNYDVVVTNQGGSVTSTTAALTVTTEAIAPSIETHPANQTVLSGAAASFSVTANGTAPLAYQWRKGGTPLTNGTTAHGSTISGANTATLSITNTKIADAGSYSVVVTNGVGSATSNAATLTVNQAPAITAQPVGAVITSGATHTLSPGYDPGSPAPTYLWQRTLDGLNFTNVGTNASLTVTGGPGTSGFYRVTATNSTGSVTSSFVYVGIESTTLGTPARAPSHNATGVNPDASPSLTFAAPPKVGLTGKIEIRKVSDNSVAETIDLGALETVTTSNTIYRVLTRRIGGSGGDNCKVFPVVVVGNQARITLTSGALKYFDTANSAYYVTVEPGAIIDSTGATTPAITGDTAWRFTTKATAPTSTSIPPTFKVNADGSQDFSTVQGAIDFIPTNNTTPVRIEIANGTYQELINFGNRHNLTLSGASRTQTIIQYLNNAPLNGGTSTRPSFYAKGNDATLHNLTITNLSSQDGGQAEALRSNGSRNKVVSCTIHSYQDTLLLDGTIYFLDSLIQGDVDYIWGGGVAMFRNCELRSMGGGELTQSRAPQTRFGFIFVDCSVTRVNSSITGYRLGRNSANSTTFGNAAFINCRMDVHIAPSGWSNAFFTAGFEANARNWEYKSTALDGTTLLDVSQRQHSRQLTDAEAAILRDPARVFAGTTDGTPAGAQSGGWVPQVAPIFQTQPASQSKNPGESVTFTAVVIGEPNPTYQWYKNDAPISGATSASYTVASVSGADRADYKVVATNSSGSVTSNTAELRFSHAQDDYMASYGLDPATTGAPTADPDSDGIFNQMEFAFGMNPTVGGTGVLTWNGAALTGRGMPTPYVETTATGVNYQAVFCRRKDWAALGLRYVVQFSGDLTNWLDKESPITVIAEDTAYQAISVPYPFFVNGKKATFFRVQVTYQP